MARNRLFGTWVLATLSLLDIRQGATSHSAETRRIKYAREALSDLGCGAWLGSFLRSPLDPEQHTEHPDCCRGEVGQKIGGTFTSVRGFQGIPQRDIHFTATFVRSYAQEFEKLDRLRESRLDPSPFIVRTVIGFRRGPS